MIAPETKTNIAVLKLDHNNFGTQGLKYLAEGLSRN